MQNVRDYISVKLHSTEESALKAVSKHTFKNQIILDENLIQTNHSIHTVFHNKLIAIGVTILELVNFNILTQFNISSLQSLV
jgi:hypothetical protein